MQSQHFLKNQPLNSLFFLCSFLLLPFACSRLWSSSGISQTLFICGDDVVVKSLVKLCDDVTSTAEGQGTQGDK